MTTYKRRFIKATEAKELLVPDRYAPSKRFNDPQQWADQFAKRAFYKHAPIDQKKQYAKELLSAPLTEFSFRPTLPQSTSTLNTNSIYPLSWDDITRVTDLANTLKSQDGQSIDDWSSTYNIPHMAFGHLKVNLNADDSDLMDDFARWLQLSRENTKRKNPLANFTQRKHEGFGNYYDALVLPYHDMRFYCEVWDLDISDEIFLEAYFRNLAQLPSKRILDKARRLIEENITVEASIALTMKKNRSN